MKLAFLKTTNGRKYRFAIAGGICTSKDFTDPLNESKDNPSMHYKKELINYLVVINKLGLNFGKREIFEGD
jgi:hypothetical protein